MVGLLYLYSNFTLFDRARRRLSEAWGKSQLFAITVYEFKAGWSYGLAIFPLHDSIDPSRFIHAVQEILGEADRMIDSLKEIPSNKTFLRSWVLGQDSLLNYVGMR